MIALKRQPCLPNYEVNIQSGYKAYGKCLKTLRVDNGGEFTSGEFEEFLSKDGVQHELMIPKYPQQNGVAERLNRTLMIINVT